MAHGDFFIGIGAEGVRIFDGHSKKEWKAEYPAGMVENLEVKDADGYLKWWAEMFKKLAIRNKSVLVVLEESTLFYKNIDKEEEAEAFWKEVPLLPDHITKNVLTMNNKLVAIAVNGKLHETLLTAVKNSKSVVIGIYPEIILPSKAPGEILLLGNLPEEGNFMKLYVSQEDETKNQTGQKKIALDVVLVAIAIILAGFVVFKVTAKQDLPAPKVSLTIAPTIEPTMVPTITPVKSEVDVKEVKILILNDSGISGKAGEISLYLKNLGYQGVTTGNSNKHKYEGLLIKVASSSAVAEKLFADLSGSYSPATPEMEWQENPGQDAVIIIGK
jgi:hypothetical protein